jgi:hypothetical protein
MAEDENIFSAIESAFPLVSGLSRASLDNEKALSIR